MATSKLKHSMNTDAVGTPVDVTFIRGQREDIGNMEQEQQEANTTLTLKLKKDRQKKIQWTEDTVDNEGVVLV